MYKSCIEKDFPEPGRHYGEKMLRGEMKKRTRISLNIVFICSLFRLNFPSSKFETDNFF